ncbi:MAG: type I methionyl aminopeptidase [Clostridia bacterium]|nr:type I methionyl aminopeptidase [Clostridia bacterium]
MITLKTPRQLAAMREAGRLAGQALQLAGSAVKPGVTTGEIDAIVYEFITKHGAKPSFLHYNGYPASACVSINNEVIHGIPGTRRILEGDIVSIDIGTILNGYQGDNAATFAAGDAGEDALSLMSATQQSLMEGIKAARAGGRLGDIGFAVQSYVESEGYSVVRQYVGHGIGEEMHEPPDVPNYGQRGRGTRLEAGMTIAIEPMVNAGSAGVRVLSDGWTVVTLDGSLSAHFEHTVAITDNGPVILTLP